MLHALCWCLYFIPQSTHGGNQLCSTWICPSSPPSSLPPYFNMCIPKAFGIPRGEYDIEYTSLMLVAWPTVHTQHISALDPPPTLPPSLPPPLLPPHLNVRILKTFGIPKRWVWYCRSVSNGLQLKDLAQTHLDCVMTLGATPSMCVTQIPQALPWSW